MAKSVDALTSEYETALAAHLDDRDDDRKRQAASKAADRLTQARAEHRADRPGMGVVTGNDEE
jgi:hypothetical protein